MNSWSEGRKPVWDVRKIILQEASLAQSLTYNQKRSECQAPGRWTGLLPPSSSQHQVTCHVTEPPRMQHPQVPSSLLVTAASWDTQNSHRNVKMGNFYQFQPLSFAVTCNARDNTDFTSAPIVLYSQYNYLSKSINFTDLKNHQRGIENTCSSSLWPHSPKRHQMSHI